MPKQDFTLWRIWVTTILSFCAGALVFKFIGERNFWLVALVIMILSLLYVTLYMEKKQPLPYEWVWDETDHDWYKVYPDED